MSVWRHLTFSHKVKGGYNCTKCIPHHFINNKGVFREHLGKLKNPSLTSDEIDRAIFDSQVEAIREYMTNATNHENKRKQEALKPNSKKFLQLRIFDLPIDKHSPQSPPNSAWTIKNGEQPRTSRQSRTSVAQAFPTTSEKVENRGMYTIRYPDAAGLLKLGRSITEIGGSS